MLFKTEIISLITILYLLNRGHDCVFVSVGDYGDDLLTLGVNRETCGLRYTPDYYNIPHKKGCFAKQYNNTELRIVYQYPPIEERFKNDNTYKARPSRYEDAPWTVEVKVGIRQPDFTEKPRYCTGVLITTLFVLTTATCVSSPDILAITVSTSIWRNETLEIRPQTDGEIYKTNVFVNENWNQNDPKTDAYDIAMIKLNQRINIEVKDQSFVGVNTVCLPEFDRSAQFNLNEEEAAYTGWGYGNSSYDRADKMKITQVRLKPSKECKVNNTLCANRTAISCAADSGGPLVQYSLSEPIRRAILTGILQSDFEGKDCEESAANVGDDVFVAISNWDIAQWITSNIIKHK